MDADLSRNDLALISEARLRARSGEARAIRQRARVSLAELGRSVGASHAAVQAWEVGRRSPSGVLAIRYAQTLRTLDRTAP